MRTALYGARYENLELLAFAEGWGNAVWRHPHFWRDGEVENFDLVVLATLRHHNRAVLEAYRARGVPVLVIELGYVRHQGHLQVSLDGLNHLPPFPCPGDRWNALGVSVAAFGGDPNGYTLVTAQKPQDASHGLSVDAYNAWLAGQSGKVRVHPLEGTNEHTLAEDLAGAKLLKTYCSTSGLEALMAGVPAVAERPELAVWGELSGETLPGMDDRMALFNRVAYGQWTLDEMRDGTCARFLRDHLLPNIPIPVTTAPKAGRRRKVKA